MVRRAEYALGKAIRKGQAEGTVASQGGTLIPGAYQRGLDVEVHDNEARRVTDFGKRGELYGGNGFNKEELAGTASSPVLRPLGDARQAPGAH